jgi:hypothetical protein
MRGSVLPSNLRKSIFWNRDGRSVCAPAPEVEPKEPLEEAPCWILSTLIWMPSTLAWTSVTCCWTQSILGIRVVSRMQMRVAISDIVVSPFDAADGEGDGSGMVERLGGVEEERLDRDTKFSRASTPRTAAPRLQSS